MVDTHRDLGGDPCDAVLLAPTGKGASRRTGLFQVPACNDFICHSVLHQLLISDKALPLQQEVRGVPVLEYAFDHQVSIGVHLFFRYLISPDIAPPHHSTLDTISFTFRNTVIYMAIVGIAVAVKMTTEWYNNEAQRKEIEKNQAEAELANLKNQVNPHFLFNTLNNIYSLIQIDPAQAQEAVHDLSGMLRYVLYESQKDTVPLAKECEFLNEYVKLMGARLTSGVKLEVSLPSSLSNRQIAPLLFIPLVENAFKHGISDTDESFIRIELKEDGEYVTCLVENSCFPKDDTDRSGSGIGITNLKRRLDLLYPGAYSFEYGRVQSVYRSLLRIRTGI